jgi:polyphosphate kinase
VNANGAQRRWVDQYFEREVRPLLIPVGLDPSHPFPQVANKSLNFIVRLGGKDAFGRENEIAIVKVPRVLPRLIRMPAKVAGSRALFVSLSSVIRAHLSTLFPGRHVGQFSQFRVTRHSDLSVDEDDVKNLRMALRQGLVHRHYGQAVRLEVSAGCSDYLSDFLLKQFELPDQALFRVAGPVNLVRLTQLIDLVNRPDLCFPPYKASFPVQMASGQSIFERLKQGDILIHQPFESFDGVLAFLRESVNDPDVLAIKQTIYRTGPDSELMDLLREAVRRGKEVTVVVELKARFDEEANINWAEMLESIGAQVLYGVVGLKTHAKMMLVTRREGKSLRRYGHLSTGNYNPRTARLYTDVSHITADTALTSDMDHVFVQLASQSRLPKLRKLWFAPFFLHRNLITKIDGLATAAGQGTDCADRCQDEFADR